MRKTASLFSKILEFVWVVGLVGLPLTSFPFFTRLTGSTVAPFTALPVFLLVIFWLVPHLFSGGRMPIEVKPLLLFVLASVAVSAGAFFTIIPTFKSATPFGQELRAFLTLGIGVSFYCLFATWPYDGDRLLKTLRWISIGGLLTLLWSLTQVAAIFAHATMMPRWYGLIQHSLVADTPFYIQSGRMNGLAIEPSWFTHLLVILYIPLWISSCLSRKSLFKVRIGKLILEDFILVLGLLEFMLSAPRISLVSLTLIGIFIMVRLNTVLVRTIVGAILKRPKFAVEAISKRRIAWLTAGVVVGLLLGYSLLAGGLAVVMVLRDYRLAKIFVNTPSLGDFAGLLILDEHSWLLVGLRLVFFERVIYWLTGLRIFGLYPWFGVGLGNAGFYFPSQLPAVSFESPEVRDLLFRVSSLPNIKNLWIRLLSETGLAGFSLFVFWFYTLWRSVRGLAQRSAALHVTALELTAMLGQLSLIALIVEGFSIDSFAMPYLWVCAGLISAAARIARDFG